MVVLSVFGRGKRRCFDVIMNPKPRARQSSCAAAVSACLISRQMLPSVPRHPDIIGTSDWH